MNLEAKLKPEYTIDIDNNINNSKSTFLYTGYQLR